MSGLKNGPITQNELMLRLANAKKVMNKVETGDYTTGNINEASLVSDESDDYALADRMLTESEPVVPTTSAPVITDVDRINNSKLPEAIKRAMIENPIAQISLNDSLNMDFVKKTKQIMESEGVSLKPTNRPAQRQPQRQTGGGSININEMAAALTPIIENIVRKVLDEKLNQILTAHTTATINENLVLKVGDTIFKGKLTGARPAK